MTCQVAACFTSLQLGGSHGLIAGPVAFRDADGHQLNLAQMRMLPIPQQPERIADIQSDAAFVLLVEKEAIFEVRG